MLAFSKKCTTFLRAQGVEEDVSQGGSDDNYYNYCNEDNYCNGKATMATMAATPIIFRFSPPPLHSRVCLQFLCRSSLTPWGNGKHWTAAPKATLQDCLALRPTVAPNREACTRRMSAREVSGAGLSDNIRHVINIA